MKCKAGNNQKKVVNVVQATSCQGAVQSDRVVLFLFIGEWGNYRKMQEDSQKILKSE